MSTLSITRAPAAAAQSGRVDLAVLYEHPHWFAALFAELERREIPFDRIFIPEHFYEVGEKEPHFKVLFNRMNPSADSRERRFRHFSLTRLPGASRASRDPGHQRVQGIPV